MEADLINKIDIKEFREIGLLQEINRQFLHPLGLALEVQIDDDGNETLGGIWDYRDDPEGMLYGENMINLKKVETVAEFMNRQHKKRKNTVGYVIQKVEKTKEENEKRLKPAKGTRH